MSVVEFIGFAVSLLSLLFLFFRNRRQLAGQGEPRDSQEEFPEDDPIQAFLKAMEKERLKREAPPSPPPPIAYRPAYAEVKKSKKTSSKEEALAKNQLESRKLASPLEKQQLVSPLAKRHEAHYYTHGVEILQKPARIRLMVERLADLKDLVVFREILDKPKSLRPWE